MTRAKHTSILFTFLILAVFVTDASAMYDAPVGRWIQRDSTTSRAEMNLYEYVSSATMTRVDPSGQFGCRQEPCGPRTLTPTGSWGLYWWSETYEPGDFVEGTRIGDLTVKSRNLWPFEKGSNLDKVNCLLNKLGLQLPEPESGIYWASYSDLAKGYTIRGRGAFWNYYAVTFISSERYDKQAIGCYGSEDLATTLWHELKGHNYDNQDDETDEEEVLFLQNYDKKVEDAYKAAKQTPIQACCAVEPNKNKPITNLLESYCCDCGCVIFRNPAP